MNLLSDFIGVQSRIELLFAIIYFFFSLYTSFLLFVRRGIQISERNLLKSMAAIFFAIAAILFLRMSSHLLYPDKEYVHGILFTILSVIVITSPIQMFICYKVNISICTIRHVFLRTITATLLCMASVFIYVRDVNPGQTMLNVFIAVAVSYFVVESTTISIMAFNRLVEYSKSEWHKIELLGSDLFLAVTEEVLSLILLLFLFLDLDYMYVWTVVLTFLILNGYVFFATCMAAEVVERHDMKGEGDRERTVGERSKATKVFSDKMKADELYDRLIVYFENKKPYLKQDLKIREVALHLYSNKTYLSRIINDKHNLNFNQFVNYYRIEEVKRLFMENSSLNIQELCTQSGFGSMATFSIAFRYHLGNTPADWCKEQKLLRGND